MSIKKLQYEIGVGVKRKNAILRGTRVGISRMVSELGIAKVKRAKSPRTGPPREYTASKNIEL